MAALAMDTIGQLPITSKGNQLALTAIYMHILCICYTDEGQSAENIVQAYLSGIFAHKGGSIAMLSDNGDRIQKCSSY